ncbi:hypothetical protein V1499_06345 [Neobacillus sp. SCS-31]|uniref:hypothetical protein n=1 Tax=Neobacillus oceani TaxID=3115292 RepID=UPI0039057EF7
MDKKLVSPGMLKPLFFLSLIMFLLAGCSDENPYEVVKSESKITELNDQLQLEWQYDISNNSDEDYYITLIFPSYIQTALVTKVEIIILPANSSTSGVAVVSAKKSGAEMTEETIKSIKNGKIPFVEQILIGRKISLIPESYK